jgi:hypothetical protein
MALSDNITEAITYLKDIKSFLDTDVITQEVRAYLKRISDLHIYLERSHRLYEFQKLAWKNVEYMTDLDRRQKHVLDFQRQNEINESWNHNGQRVEYSHQRHLVLTSYVTVTWSIYDNLFNVVGYIITVPDITKELHNLKLKLPSLYRSNEAKKYPLTIHTFVKNSFGWYCAFSYEIRNWLVHEGEHRCNDNIKLFKSDKIDDGFTLSNESKEYFEDNSKELMKDYDDCFKADQELANKWNNGDITEILAHCHDKIDNLFEKLLPWAIESLKKQIQLFT